MRVNEKPYKSDDLVWDMNKTRKRGMCPKMQIRWTGPLITLKRLNDVTYQVRISAKELKVMHYDLLKPFEGQDVPCWVQNAAEKVEISR